LIWIFSFIFFYFLNGIFPGILRKVHKSLMAAQDTLFDVSFWSYTPCEPLVQWLGFQAQDQEVGGSKPGATGNYLFY
jgi:hypothetical protein